MQLEVLTDTVKDNDGIVDGITDNRQESRDKRRINLPSRKGEHRQHDKDIMHERQHRRHTEAPFKAIGNISDDKCPGHHQSQHGIGNQLTADGCADLFLTEHIIVTHVRLNGRHNFLALCFLHIRGANHHIFRFRHTGFSPSELNLRTFQTKFSQARTHLSDSHRPFKFQIHNGTAGEVDTKVKALGKHTDKPGHNNDCGNGEPDFGTPGNIKLVHALSPPFSTAYNHWHHRHRDFPKSWH